MGGKSGSQIVGYWYRMGLHFAICHGPVDFISRILVGDRVAWDGLNNQGGAISILARNLFGGEKREGGVEGTFDVMTGKATQGKNSYLVSQLGSTQPAYRGLFGGVFRGGYVAANNPYVKPWAFTICRIINGWEGNDPFYPQKAGIVLFPVSGITASKSYSYDTTWDYLVTTGSEDYSGRVDEGYQQGQGAFGDSGFSLVYNTPVTPECGKSIWIRKTLPPQYYTEIEGTSYSDDGYWLYHNGSLYQPGGNGARNISITINAYDSPTIVQKVTDCVPSGDATNIANALTLNAEHEVCSLYIGMNPAHIIYECITNTDWGMGYPATFIDETNFKAVADTLYSEGLGLCGIWNKQEQIDKFISRVLDHCGAIQQVDRRTGKFKLKLIRDDYDPDTLPTFDEDDILSFHSFERPGYGDLINEINVVYDDVITTKSGGVTLQNLASVQAQEGIVSETKQYPMLPTFDLALRVAQRDLMSTSVPLARITITCTRAAWDMEPGDVIKISWPKLGIASLICRVMQADYGRMGDSKVKLELTEDVFGLPASSFVVEQPSGWEEPDLGAKLIDPDDILEAPYYYIATQYPAGDFSQIENDTDIGFIRTVGARPTTIGLGYELNARLTSETEYNERPGTHPFAPTGLLTVDIGKLDTIIFIDEIIGDDEIPTGNNVLAMIGQGRDAELIQVTSSGEEGTDGLQYTVERGMLDTVPQEWFAGERIWWITSRMGIDITEYTHGDDVGAKLLCRTTSDEFLIADQPALSMTMDSRFGRPYPPGNFLIDGEQYPAAPSFPLVVTWAHRDREQQTAGLITQDNGNIGPEIGTTYNARLYVDNALTDEYVAETDTTATFEEGTETGSLYRVELESERGSLLSWQKHVHEFGVVPPGYDFLVLSMSPVGYWALDESAGTVAADSTANNNDGTLQNMEDADWVPGKVKNCLSMDGTNEYVDCGAATVTQFSNTDPFSIALWLKLDASFSGIDCLVSHTSGGTSWYLQVSDGLVVTNGLLFDYNRSSSNRIISNASVINPGQWHFIVFTSSGSGNTDHKIYVDSVDQTATDAGFNSNQSYTNSTLKMGDRADTSGVNLHGLIDEVAIFDYALTPTQIQELYDKVING